MFIADNGCHRIGFMSTLYPILTRRASSLFYLGKVKFNPISHFF